MRGRERERERIKERERARGMHCFVVARRVVLCCHYVCRLHSCGSMTALHSGGAKEVCRFKIFVLLSSQQCEAWPRCSPWPKVLVKGRCSVLRNTHNTHRWVSPPNKTRCRPIPARQQESQGRGRACGPGLVLLALPLQCNRNSKGCLQCNIYRPKINGQSPFDGGAPSDVATCWRLGHADCRDIPAKGWTGKEQSGSG